MGIMLAAMMAFMSLPYKEMTLAASALEENPEDTPYTQISSSSNRYVPAFVSVAGDAKIYVHWDFFYFLEPFFTT